MASTAPHVTCLMVTRGRVPMATRAIDDYLRQDYPARDLTVLCDGTDDHEPLAAYARARGRSDITVTSVPRDVHSLGALRNAAVAAARGEVICQWDDDDRYHPRRLSTQVAQMVREKAHACFLTEQLHLFLGPRSLFWCDWAHSRDRALPRIIPNTLMCEREAAGAYPETGSQSRRGEDEQFMIDLCRRCRVTALRDMGELYIYVAHGANTWAEIHHRRIASVTGLDAEALMARRARLTQALGAYALGFDAVVRDFANRVVYSIPGSGEGSDDGQRLDRASEPARAGTVILP